MGSNRHNNYTSHRLDPRSSDTGDLLDRRGSPDHPGSHLSLLQPTEDGTTAGLSCKISIRLKSNIN